MDKHMKYSLITSILVFNISLAIGQVKADSLKVPFNCSCKMYGFEKQEVYTIVEKMPEYSNGGTVGFMKFLKDSTHWGNSHEDSPQMSLYFSFVIDTEGNVTNKCVQRPRHTTYLTEAEKSVLEALDKMEKWIPGEQNGVKVSVKYNLPIKICIR
jgi:protein TonB